MLFQVRGGVQKKSIGFLLFVKEKLPFGADPRKDEWISTQATRAMETFEPMWNDELDPIVIDIVRWRGLEFACSVYVMRPFTVPLLLTRQDRVLPRFSDDHMTLDQRADFGKGLIKYKEELIALPRGEGQTSNAELLDHILDKILRGTIPQVLERDKYYPPHSQGVTSLFSICITGNRTKSYEDLLDLISCPGEEPFYTQYLDFYAKVIPDLVKLLGEHGIRVSSSPSCKFFSYIIGRYLEEVLGSKEGSPYLKCTMFTCGHEPCSRVNDFLRSEEKEITITLDDELRKCVPGLKIGQRYQVLEWMPHWHPKPPRITLTKEHAAMAAQHWSIRCADAQKLLGTIGAAEEISRIMGERYPDVVKALEGSQAFVVTETQRRSGRGKVGRN